MKLSAFKCLIVSFLLFCFGHLSAQMSAVSNFGSNPGNLEMLLFRPSSPKSNAGVVLVLHGCGQSATNFAEQTGWNVLAEKYGFYVIFAQQKRSNNLTKCFNWFKETDNRRNEGEAASLAQMVTYVHNSFSTDSTKNFVCGLSGGGALTPVMMSCYPDIFAAGGTWAGVPYLYTPSGNNDISAQQWGNKAKSAFPNYEGKYPTLFICQGKDDGITEPINESRLVAQWTNVHGADQVADLTNSSFRDNPNVEEKVYLNAANDTIVKSYIITNMAHGVAVDPGSGLYQGGKTSAGSFDVDFYSTYWMARFFGLTDDTVSSKNEATKSRGIKVFLLNDGSLKVTKRQNSKAHKIKIYDIMGRRFLEEKLDRGGVIFPPSKLPGSRLFLVTIVDRNNLPMLSKILVRR